MAPAARPSSQPVVAPVTAKPLQPAARTTLPPPTASPTPSPTPSPTASPSPIPSVTGPAEPTPKVEAAGLTARRKASHEGLASRVLGLGSDLPGPLAFVLFLAAAGGSGAVWLVRRLHV